MAKLTSVVAGGIVDVSTAFRVAPEAVYTIKIEGVELKKSKAGDPMIVVTFTIVDELADDGTNVKGISMIENYVLELGGKPNEIALRIFKQLVEAVVGKERASDEDFDTDELIGWTGSAQVKIDSYESQGETRQKNVIKKIVG